MYSANFEPLKENYVDGTISVCSEPRREIIISEEIT
uniref:Uncharacterized protein n=1 Tax=Anguilla anguilla TaxID=7936 RepID=A0A0E9S8R7_ANGAN